MSLADSVVFTQSPRLVYSSTESLSRVAFHPGSGALLAVGSETRVQIISVSKDEDGRWTTARAVARWSLFTDITSLAWSRRSTETYFELVVALASTNTLAVLTYSAELGARVRPFGIGLTSGRIHEVQCGRTVGQQQLVASVGDDGVLRLWDLAQEETPCRSILHPHPLRSVSFHPTNASQLLTLDSRGYLRLWHWPSSTLLLSLTEPQSLSARGTRGDAAHGEWNSADGGASLGAVIDGRWGVWDLRRLAGGNATGYGTAYGDECRGREVFGWNSRNPRQFATLSTSPHASALKIYTTSFPQAPRIVDVAPRPQQAQDMSWSPADDLIAVVVGHDLVLVDVAE
ncbi:WD40-repeat-containing domain protein [Leucosporidium creatinivorum]|uniref:WD40-repeat-containing domain protein n=1 Tax=Leucosporidium creatinivorum TaxID=106004 RepID=A0A1Y2FZ74_9BASI|nr:WD40-repeat-containing domain protein [Leucosporidium creatinivorum]